MVVGRKDVFMFGKREFLPRIGTHGAAHGNVPNPGAPTGYNRRITILFASI